jgi:F-type H+-transporting ATPase subunit b
MMSVLLTTAVFGLFASDGLDPLGIPKLVNLILFAGLLYYLLRKPAREFFAKRLKDVRSTLDRAARERETATTKLKEIDDRLARFDREITEIRAQTDRETEVERVRIQKETEREAERLRQLAKREIGTATLGAIIELRKFAADKSVELAEQMIRSKLTLEDDRRLVDRASSGLGSVK